VDGSSGFEAQQEGASREGVGHLWSSLHQTKCAPNDCILVFLMSHPVPAIAFYDHHHVQDKAPYEGAGRVGNETVELALGMAKKNTVLSWKVSSIPSLPCPSNIRREETVEMFEYLIVVQFQGVCHLTWHHHMCHVANFPPPSPRAVFVRLRYRERGAEALNPIRPFIVFQRSAFTFTSTCRLCGEVGRGQDQGQGSRQSHTAKWQWRKVH
jgi:hypothetical protein